MARDEVWDALKNHAKQVHSERVAKNPDRIAYAIQQFEAHGIEYQLKNEQTGHFHCWRKSDDNCSNSTLERVKFRASPKSEVFTA